MTEAGADELGAMERIEILPHEYDCLRAEILNRTTQGFQVVAISAVVLTLFFVDSLGLIGRLIAVSISAPVVAIGSWFILRDIGKASERLRELEADINRRAGEDLLVWETRWGSAVTGFWGRARPLPAQSRSETG